VVNGTFFDSSVSDQAPLAFSIKAQNQVITGYADTTEYKGKKRVLLFDGKTFDIKPYADDPDSLLRVVAHTAIVGLDPAVAKSAASRRGRTFVATAKDGSAFIYTSPGTTQRYVMRMLQSFGADPHKIMMLDGGGSSYLLTKGKLLLPQAVLGSEPYARALPQVLVVQSGNAKLSSNE